MNYVEAVLLERDVELGLIDTFLDDVTKGEGGTLVIEGPAGIGKTAMLGELDERAASRRIDVLHARASQLDRGFSFGVARQLLERRISAATDADRGALLGGVAHDSLQALGMADDEVAGDRGERSLHGLYWVAANIAGRGPLVLCVDDAHWADRSSLRWLLYSAQRLTGLQLGIAIATRPTEPGAAQDLLDGLALGDSATLVSLRPLSSSGTAALVGASLAGAPAPEFEAACHESTGGNPLLVRELLRELRAEEAKPSAEGAGRIVEFGVEAVARSVRRRLHELGPTATVVAQAVAVVGNGARVVEVAALCDLEESSVRAAAVDLTATELLLAESILSFVHPLVRAAVYDELPVVERAALHRRVAELRDGTTKPEQVAVHLLRAEPRSEAHVVAVLREAAAEAARRGAPDAAVTFLRRALAEPPEPGPRRAAVLVELGQAEALARMDGFKEHLTEAIDEIDDTDEAAAVALSLGQALCALGDGVGAFEVVSAAEAKLRPESATWLKLEAELLAFAWGYAEIRPQVDERVCRYMAALEHGERVDALVLGALSPWLLAQPPADRAAEAAEDALADERLTSTMEASLVAAVAGYTLLGAGRAGSAAKVFDGAVAVARRRGERLMLGLVSTFHADILFRLGKVVESEAEARVGWEAAIGEGLAMPGQSLGLMAAGGMLINALVARGEIEEAQLCAERAPQPLPVRSELFLPARAELRLAQGRLDEAIADLRAIGELLGEEFHKPVQNWRVRLAIVLGSIGARAEARALAAAELAQARQWEAPPAIGVALMAAGIVEGGSDGIGLLESAVETLAKTEWRLDHALALIELGALMRRCGSRTAAREPLRAGMDMAARCGATAYADRAHAELIAAGARPRRDRRFLTGPESLTSGELRVAALAADGLTDRAIAQHLHVTQAAVQFHLRNSFRKLGIRARGELAAALEPVSAGSKS